MTLRRAAVALLALAACAKSEAPPPPTPPEAKCTEAKPCALVPGTDAQNQITAAGQVDRYLLAVPAPGAGQRTLLKLALSSSAPVSPVRLVFLVLAPDGAAVLGTRGPVKGSGAQRLAATFLLPGAGSYPIVVRDATTTNVDTNATYTLSAQLVPDPDPAEPDDLPALARAVVPAAAGAAAPETRTGFIASAGDRDLLAFDLAAPGLVRWTVSQGIAGGTLQLRARILQRLASAPDDLAQAAPVVEVSAAQPGAGLESDQMRYLVAGRYLVALDDKTGAESDERAAAQWQVGLQRVAEPDPNEQSSRNDLPETATALPLGTTLEGAIGSQGDVDWYEVALPAAATPKLLELRLEPRLAASALDLDWAVGDLLAAPSAPCDSACGPFAFCGGGKCLYQMRALHHFARNEVAPQVVRLRHLGAARTVRVVVSDQGSDSRSAERYAVSAALLADPDPHEATALNDTLAAATPVGPQALGGGAVRFDGGGQISWWEYVDGRTTAQQAADLDWYELQLPPRAPAPGCPDPLPPDAGPCTPDGGTPVLLPRPAYGMAVHWRGPADGVYRLGLQGAGPVDGGTACLFSFDETRGARAEGDGGYVYGDQPSDLCLCLPAAQAAGDRLWLRVEAAHRPTPPAPNQVSDQPYGFAVDLVPAPGGLQTACDGGCTDRTAPLACP